MVRMKPRYRWVAQAWTIYGRRDAWVCISLDVPFVLMILPCSK